jgi:gliding motility-associated-like protein
VNPVPAMTSANTASICSGGTVSIPLTSNVASTYTWIAGNNANTTGESTTLQSGSPLSNTIVNTTTSSQVVTYTVTPTSSAGSCLGTTQTVSVTVNPAPTMTSAAAATICSGGTVSIPLTSDMAATYTWIAGNNANTTGESTTLQSTSTLSNTITNTTTAVQTVTYTVTPTATAGGCVGATQTVTVTVNPVPAMTSASTATICSGGTVNIPLTSNVAATYTWIASNNANTTGESTALQSSSTLNNTIVNTTGVVQTVTYTVTPTSTAGSCLGTTQTVTVTVNPVPTMTSANSAAICSGAAVNIPLTSDIASTYTWIAGNNANTTGESTTLQSTSTLSNTIVNTTTSSQVVTYTVTPTATAGGCVGATQTVTVTVNPAPTMTSAATATICSGGTVSIPLTSDVAATYTWIAGNNANTTGESTTLQSTSTLSNTITNTTTAVQTVTYTVTPTATAGGCVGATQTVTVTVNPVPAMTSASTATICSGGTVNIPLTSNVAATYTWIASNNANTTGESTALQSSSTLNNTIVNTTGVVQTVTYTVTPTSTAGSCLGTTQTVTVTVNPVPAMTSANSATICSGAAVNIPLTSDIASTYTWIAGDNANTTGESTTLQSTGTLNNTITNTSAVVQTVTYTVTPTATTGGCSGAAQTVTVTVNPIDNASFSYSSSTYCQTGANPTPTITGLAGGTFSSSAGLVFVSTATGQINLAASTLGTYTVTYSTTGSCPTTGTFNVTITTAPSAVFSYAGPYCQSDTDPVPAFGAGASAGTFSSTAGLVFISTSTGQIDLSASTAGTYTVTNNIPAAGGCGAASATASVTIDPIATVNAGIDQTTCASTPTVTLAGTIGGSAATATWTGGAGTFTPNNTTLNATYAPSPAEISAGAVTLTLTTNDPAGACPAVLDQMTITIDPAATVSAGADQTSCASASTVTLAGVIGGSATSATWSGGAGTFTPNNTTLNATYAPSAAEITAGTVTLTLTTNDPAGVCPAVTDQMTITINQVATVNAGSDLSSCSSSSTVTLGGVVGGSAVSGTWSGGAGTFTPNNTTLNATYAPSAAEITAGTVTLTLTTNDPAGPCAAVTDQVTITINPAATVSAGADQVSCASASTVTLAGVTGGSAASATWSGGAGTFTPNNTTLNATYAPSAGEITAGTVTLTLTTNDPAGPCGAVTDQMTITINQVATVNAGSDLSSCSSSSTVTLGGVVGGSAVSGTWSGGAGTFTPNNTTLNATYAPSAAEITAGTVTLTLTTNDPAGPCAAVTDQVIITIDPAATVSAGADQVVCGSSSTVTLAGVTGGSAASATWSGGAGTFTPNNTTLNATYAPSAAEITAGTVTLTLTTNDPSGPCSAVNDQMTITIDAPATVDAGIDQSVCGSSSVILAGITGGSATSGTWSGGAGIFTPNNTTLNATYAPTAAEIAAGGVTLTLTTNDPAGACAAVTDQMTIGIDPVPTVDAGPDQSACASSAVFTLAGTLGGSASSGTWTGGSGTFTPDNTTLNAMYTPSAAEITSGSVTLTLTTNDPSGPCAAATDQVTFTITPLDDAAFNYGSSTYCATGADPSANITGLPGGTFTATGGLIINSSTGLVDLSASPLASYTITYSTNGACPNSSTFDITITNSPSAEFSYSGPYCQSAVNPSPVFGAGASAGTFSSVTPGVVFVSTLTGEIDLLASTPGTYSIINNIPAGGGCAAAADTTVVTIDQSANVSAGIDATICGDGTYTLNGTFGGSASSIVWFTSGSGTFNDNDSIIAVYSPSAADITAGSVTITILTDDPSGACNAEVDDMILTINPPDSAGFNYGGSTFCQTGGNVIPTTSTPGTFSSAPAGLVFVSTATGEINVAGSALGTYTITYITSGICPDTASASVTITLSPSAAFTYAGPYCQGSVNPLPSFGPGASGGTFTSAAGLVFANSSTGEIDLTLSSAGTYNVTNTIAASGGCAMAVDSFSVVINPLPDVDAGADQLITCSSSSVTLNGNSTSAGASYSWTGGTIVSGGSTATPLVSAAGTYTLTVTASGCSDMDTVIVSVDTLAPIVDAGAAQTLSCAVTTATLSGSSFTPDVSFSWTGGTILSGAATANPIVSAAGTYTLTVTDSSSGCTSADTVVVTNNTTVPNANAGADQTIDCINTTTTLSGSSSSAGATFSWTGGTIISGGTTANPLVSGAGTYTLTVTDSVSGCTSVDSVNVTNTAAVPDANAGTAQAIDCINATVSLNGSSITPGVSFNWTGGTIVSGANTATPVVSTAGTYTVTVTDPSNGCTNTSTVAVTVNNTPPVADAGTIQSVGCGVSNATLNGTASASGAGISYAWTTGTGNIISGGTTTTPLVDQSGIYTITVTDAANGCSATDTVSVLSAPGPIASFTASPSSGFFPLPVSFTNTSQNANTYSWDLGNGNFSGVTDPSEIYTAPGTYVVTLVASFNSQCHDTARVTITVFDELELIIPNIFTPNGDNNNDLFVITSTGVDTFHGEIFDRWGLKLFAWDRVNEGWDGRTTSGNMATDGTYYYIITVKGMDGKEKTYTGFVQLLR